MNSSPLGRYSEPAALVTALGIIAVWILVQVGLLSSPGDPSALNAAATLSIGIILGQRSTTNGAAKVALAAHRRLDQINAPPADDGASGGPVA